MRRSLILVLLLVAAGGCSTQPPRVEVQDALVVDRSVEAMQIDFSLELFNPNEEPIPLLNCEYTLFVEGREVFRGKRAALTTLDRNGTRRIMLPAVIPYADANWPGAEAPESFRYRLTGELQYIAPGELAEILFDTGVRRPKVGFSAAGRLTVLDAGPVPPRANELAPEPDGTDDDVD